MKIKKTKSIKVGSRKYEIIFADDELFFSTLSKKNENDFDDAKSYIDYDDQVIFIRSCLKSDFKRELLIHELLHACIEDSGIATQDEICEMLIRILSPRLNQLLTENLATLLKDI